MRHTIFIFLLILASACGTKKPLIGEDFTIGLEKGACFGSCPVYSLKIDHKGYAIFDGVRFTDKIGKHALNLSKVDLDLLANSFSDANLDQYLDEYNSEIVDLPLISISYLNNGKEKVIRGKTERPQALKDLQVLLENVAHSEGWISLDTTKVKAPPVEEEIVDEEPEKPKEIIIDSELVVRFNEGTIISRWIKQFRDFDMFVQKPTSEDRRTWIVQFNKSKIEPKELLSKVQADPGVESADFHKIKPETEGN